MAVDASFWTGLSRTQRLQVGKPRGKRRMGRTPVAVVVVGKKTGRSSIFDVGKATRGQDLGGEVKSRAMWGCLHHESS